MSGVPLYEGPTPEEVRETAERVDAWVHPEMERTGESREAVIDRAIQAYTTGAIKRRQLGEEPHERDRYLLEGPVL